MNLAHNDPAAQSQQFSVLSAGNGQPPPNVPPDKVSDEAPDPFDPKRLRLSPTDPATLGVREVISRVSYQQPGKETYFRVHPSPEYCVCGGVIELKEGDSATYWIDPSLWSALDAEPTFSRRMIFTCVTTTVEDVPTDKATDIGFADGAS